MTTVKVKNLVKACRRRGKQRVTLEETQLTCMYNYIKNDGDSTIFSLYPPDMLLYYDYSLVPVNSCRAYFTELGDADFSVFSSTLNYKLTALFTNARNCLGITNTSLSRDNVEVLGNMCCTLESSYIKTSDPLILEKLKNCPDFTSEQAAAMEALLLSGTTTYGIPSTWRRTTLDDLDILPLYMTENFFGKFDTRTKRSFLRSFMKVLRRTKVPRRKRAAMRRAIQNSIRSKSKRSVTADCTVGEITLVTISDESFPFDYNLAQFNFCLDNQTVKNNLVAITTKVDQEDFLSVVLTKLQQAYAALGVIPDEQVQVLGAASRQATTQDINMWNITKIDTLSALMDSTNGNWDAALAKAIVTKYLSQSGNTLGTAELNAITWPNLCTLDASVLSSITPLSFR
ncbi:mesothelin-like protein [Aplochiton taeniatus]